jgi:hypothetical protein
MHCNGKCHLKKQLEKEDRNQQTPGSSGLKDKNEVQFISNPVVFRFISFPRIVDFNSSYLVSVNCPPHYSIFHPPKS